MDICLNSVFYDFDDDLHDDLDHDESLAYLEICDLLSDGENDGVVEADVPEIFLGVNTQEIGVERDFWTADDLVLALGQSCNEDSSKILGEGHWSMFLELLLG